MSENETTEYKKTLGQLNDGLIAAVAILNKHMEGELWFGVRDDGVSVGVKAAAANGQRTPEKNLSDSDTITKTITKTAQEQFSPTESTIFELVKNNPTITLADMATRLGMSVVGVRYHTDSLQAKGCLWRIGRRYGHWEIIQDFDSRAKQGLEW
jgi:ATP-dependent DNA helicase RecG